MIMLRKFVRAMRAGCPKWLVWVWIAAGLIPTPFEVDELIPLTLTVLVMAIQWQRFPRAMSAWRGGKSHRAYDARMELA
jgi:hypothetical protein